MSIFLVLSIKILICSSYLNLLTPYLINNVRECIAKIAISNELKCDHYIYKFLKASNSAVSEIYSQLKTDFVPEPQSGTILGVASGVFQLSSSTTLYNYSPAARARFNFRYGDGLACWWGATPSTDEFIQVSSSIPVLIQAVQTQGCPWSDSRMTKIKLLYTLDGLNWVAYNNGEELQGNFDRSTINRIVVSPFIAKSLRLYASSWSVYVATRLEVEISKISYDPLPPKRADQVWIAAIKSGFNVLTSSIYDPNYDTKNLILYYRSLRTTSAWCAAFNNNNQWISISSPVPVSWNQITLQGSSQSGTRGKITKFSVSYTLDGIVWTDFKNKQIFQGSYDLSTPVSVALEPSFSAIAIKVNIVEYSGGLCMRLEAFCSKISS